MPATRRSRTASTGSSACRAATRCCGSSCRSTRSDRPRRSCGRAAPSGRSTSGRSSAELALSQQLGQCLAQWLSTRRLPLVSALADFTLDDLRAGGGAARDARTCSCARARRSRSCPRRSACHRRASRSRSCASSRSSPATTLARSMPRSSSSIRRIPVARRNRYVSGLLARRDRSPRDPARRRGCADVRASRTSRSGASRSRRIARSRTWACAIRASRRA